MELVMKGTIVVSSAAVESVIMGTISEAVVESDSVMMTISEAVVLVEKVGMTVTSP
jgi:hypothetical protein